MSDADTALAYFQSQGWSAAQAAGIVGNLQSESNLSANAYGDSGQAYGIAQWHPDRQALFQKVFGKPIQQSTYAEQLQFVNYELTNSPGRGGSQLKSSDTAGSAASVFAQYFEAPKSTDYSSRVANANNLYSSSSSLLDRIKDAVTNGSPISLDGLKSIISGPSDLATNTVTNAIGDTAGAVSGIANFNIGDWLAKQLNEGTKEYIIPIALGAGALIFIALSAWGMVSNTQAGSAVKSAAKTGAKLAMAA